MFRSFIENATRDLVREVLSSYEIEENVFKLEMLANKIREAIEENRTVYFFGNGGSAAEATHLAAEFTSHCLYEHKPWSAISLNESISALTAISNDFNFEAVFARQVEAHVKPKDVVIGLSTSGKSPNVLNGINKATAMGAFSVLLTSVKFENLEGIDCKLVLEANSKSTTRIQEIHLHWMHTIIEYIETVMREDR